MSKKDCLTKVKMTHRETLEKLYNKEQKIIDEAEALVNEKSINEMHDELVNLKAKYIDPEVFRKKAVEILNSRRRESMKKRLEVVETQQMRTRFTEFIKDPAFKGNYAEGLEAMLDTTPKAAVNAANNVSNKMGALSGRYQTILSDLFEPYQQKIIVKDPAKTDLIINEILENSIDTAMVAKYDDVYIDMARRTRKFLDFMWTEKRKAGFDLGHVKDYVPVTYEGGKIRADRDAAYKMLREEGIDTDASFPGLNSEQIDKIVKKIIDNNVDVDLSKGLMDLGMLELSGRSSLEARATRSRKLVYKKGFVARWNQKFGRANLLENLGIMTRTAAKQNALRSTFGPKPKSMFEGMIKISRDLSEKDVAALVKKIEGTTDKAELKKLNKELKKAKKISDKLSGINLQGGGKGSSLVNNMWAILSSETRPLTDAQQRYSTFSSNKRAFSYMSKLGGSTFTALTDIASMGAGGARMGEHPFKSYPDAVAAWAKTFPDFVAHSVTGKKNELTKEAGRLGVHFEQGIGALHRMNGQDGNVSKGIAKLAEWHTRINPIGNQAAAHRTAFLSMTADKIARRVMANDQDGSFLITMNRAGLTEEYRPALLEAIAETSEFDTHTIDYDSIAHTSKETLKELRLSLGKKDSKYLGMSDTELKTDIQDKLEGLYSDLGRTFVPEVGLRQQAITSQGMRRGTFLGELVADAFMLKSFAFKMHDTVQNVIHASPNQAVNMRNTAAYGIALWGMGYGVLALNDLRDGKTPREWNTETAIEAAVKGGFGGIYGDVMNQAINNDYGNFTSAMAGPAFSTMDNAARLGFKSVRGELKMKDLNKVRQEVPFQNHFLVKPAIDYMFYDAFINSADPQRKRRERKRMKDRGQKKLFK